MGTPIEPEPDGVACSLCWGSIGSTFGAGAPPGSLLVDVKDIAKGTGWVVADGEPPDGFIRLQNIGACNYGPGTFRSHQILFASFQTSIELYTDKQQVAFFAFPAASCVSFFENGFTDPSGKFFGGTAEIIF